MVKPDHHVHCQKCSRHAARILAVACQRTLRGRALPLGVHCNASTKSSEDLMRSHWQARGSQYRLAGSLRTRPQQTQASTFQAAVCHFHLKPVHRGY